jgi:limonene-1,2-epoxide hydrolase
MSALETVNRLIAGWEARDVDAICACFTPDAVWHNMPMAPIEGVAAIREMIARFLGSAEEVRFEMRHACEAAPGVVMTERVDIFRQKDGKTMRLPVMGTFELEGGLVKAWRDYYDSAAMAAG